MSETIGFYTDLSKLVLKLRMIDVSELQFLNFTKHAVYFFKSGCMQTIMKPNASIEKDQYLILKKNGIQELFVHDEDYSKIKQNFELSLTKVTRSLSMGDPLENGEKEITLISKNLTNLYSNPHDDELLKLQFQSTQNLSKFLIDNKKHQAELFFKTRNKHEHFIISQPMESSLLLLAFLQQIKLFNNNEIENLFLTSYLKDLGLSLIPSEKYDLQGLNDKEMDLFANHSDFSKDLLHGRVPLTTNYLNIVKNHHFLNEKLKKLLGKETDQNDEVMIGLETTLVAVFDMLVAMTSDRPYRKKLTMFQALEIIKRLMADDYPQEYRALILFIKQFFKN